MRDAITIKISSLTQHEARSIGCENLCHSTLRMLKIREYLTMRGWERMDIDIALMQIIARAIYPYSELKTVRYLKENTALAEIFKIPKEKITKDVLYNSALRLWEEHRGLEDWLHERVCNIFNIEEKVLLSISPTPTSRASTTGRRYASTAGARKSAATARLWCWLPW